MFVVSLVEFSKHVQNEISAKVMPKPQNFTADFADRTDRRNYDPPKTPNYAERTTGPRSEISAIDLEARIIWIADAHRGDGRRFIVPAFFMLNEIWLGPESNRRHVDFQSTALPTELPSR
jgi:hypothetical protein